MPAQVRVLMNEKSGGCMGRRGEIEEAFRACGLPCEIVPLHPGTDVAQVAREAGETPETVLVAAGGDGTVNAVASAVAGTGVCMGVLALGTLNHFAKDLGLPLEVAQAVAVIANGQPRPVDVGEVNGQVFVNNSSLGFYPGMVLQRERLKKVGWNKWFSMTVASARAFIRFRQINVCVTVEDAGRGGPPERHVCRTPFVFIGNNEYTMEGAEAGSRKCLDAGRLYLYMAPGATRMSLLRLTLAALRGKVREAPEFESMCISEFTVELRRRVHRVSLDGEVRRIDGMLHYRIRPGALQVIAPVVPGNVIEQA